jgi:polar amino acid transport system substrate-binding protein
MKMKRVILSIVLLILMGSGANAADLTVNVATGDIANVPRILGEGSTLHEPPGIQIELLMKAARQVGINVKITRLPSKRVLDNLEKGQSDAAFIFSYSEDRAKYAAYPMKKGNPDSARKIYNVGYAIYKQKNSPLEWDGKKFLNLKGVIGSMLGWSVSEELSKMGLKVEEVKTHKQNLEKLKLGRVDAVVGPEEVIDYLILINDYKNLEKLQKPYSEKPYFVIFNKKFKDKNSEIIEKLWDKIGEIREKTISELMPKYEKFLLE